MNILISEEYRKMQEAPQRNPNYGAGKGCLDGTLHALMLHLPLIQHYDPARTVASAARAIIFSKH